MQSIRRILSPLKKAARRSRPIIWGQFRKLAPISNTYGFDRGLPIDRYYIEKFLNQNKEVIQGCLLEIGDRNYTIRFGRNITKSDILDYSAENHNATIIGDLSTGANLNENQFDCLIITQTYQMIFDLSNAIFHSFRILKPGGFLLATIPGISQISRYDMDRWGDYWRFTDLSSRKIFSNVFGKDNVQIKIFGNILSATSFLQGISSEELKESELDYLDLNYQVTIGIRAQKT